MKKERHIDIVANLPERLFVRFKRECWRKRRSEAGLIVEILEKTLPKKEVKG